eukprot:tig00020629_g12440.t1
MVRPREVRPEPAEVDVEKGGLPDIPLYSGSSLVTSSSSSTGVTEPGDEAVAGKLTIRGASPAASGADEENQKGFEAYDLVPPGASAVVTQTRTTTTLHIFRPGDRPGGAVVDSTATPETYSAFVRAAAVSVRLGFLRKVYGILSLQLLITTATIVLFMFVADIRNWVQASPTVFWIAVFLPLALFVPMWFKRHSYPTNMVLLLLWTIVEAYTIAVICTYYSAMVVLEAAGLTAGITICLTLYTLQTSRDFSFMGAGLFVVLGIFAGWGLIQLFVPLGPVTHFVFSLVGAVLFGLYIVYDTSVLVKHLKPDEYIWATISLYLDVTRLFVFIISLIGGSGRRME